MRARRILACLLLVSAGVVAFTQTHFLVAGVMLGGFPHHYAIQSSIENFGFAIVAATVGFFLLRRRGRFWLLIALIIAGGGLWLFVIHELWLHYYELPHKHPYYAEVHPPYFSGPLWWVLVRLSWHITLPGAFILAIVLLFRRAPNTELELTVPRAPVHNLND
jgi:hypothetical protein